MPFQPNSLDLSSLLKAAFAGVMLSAVVSCADTLSPASAPELEPNGADLVIVPEAEKAAFLALGEAPSLGTASFSNPSASYSVLAGPMASMSASSGPRAYVVSRVPFLPEPSPANVLPTLRDDGFFPFFIPIGFDFEFYGDVHDKFNVNYNGFVTFGDLPVGNQAFYMTGNIPVSDDPNNMIALAWTDWNPAKAAGSIRYETRGDAPNRRLVLEFAGVPEVGGKGFLTSQLVLEEGSNRVTIYTTSMTITAASHRITQGVENFLGNSASFDSVTNAVTRITSPRVRGFFNLASDAVSFLPPPPNRAPVVLLPANISVNTASGSCSAQVDVGMAGFTDDADGASLVGGVRSDELPLDAPYPKGVTTIAWTSIDVEEKTTTANQLVTVLDAEKPSITAPEGVSVGNDPGLASAVVVAGSPVAADNCEPVSVAGERSDRASMSAPFPVGLTTITWIASDESGNSESVTQSVLVRD
ncbi:MAG: HYR domain-containing protein, partial [Thermoanaerobaculia bacterium]